MIVAKKLNIAIINDGLQSILWTQVKINEVPQMQGLKLRDEVNNSHFVT